MSKWKKYLIPIFVLIFAVNVFPQDEISESAKILEERIKTEGGQAILDAGNTGDKSLIPYLKKIASTSRTPWVQIALAKLGDEDFIKKILIQSDSDDEYERFLGMDSLVRVGGKTAFKKLYEKLLELKPLPNSDEESSFTSVDQYEGAYELFHYLKHLAGDNSPKADVNIKNYWTVQLKLWKKWFEEHEELIE